MLVLCLIFVSKNMKEKLVLFELPRTLNLSDLDGIEIDLSASQECGKAGKKYEIGCVTRDFQHSLESEIFPLKNSSSDSSYSIGKQRISEYIKVRESFNPGKKRKMELQEWVNDLKKAKSEPPYLQPDGLVMRFQPFGATSDVIKNDSMIDLKTSSSKDAVKPKKKDKKRSKQQVDAKKP